MNATGSGRIWELFQALTHQTNMAYEPLDDLALIEACRAGRTDAFGLLVRRYQDRLYPTVLRLVGRPDEAEDVLQDAFVRAFERLNRFHGESSFYTWLYRITVNLAVESCRKRRVRRMPRLGDDEAGRHSEPVDASSESNPTLAIERRERDRMVQRALSQLCPEHRAVVVLKDFEGRRYEEIALILDIPVGTVRSRLHRARAELRHLLADLIDPAPSVPGPSTMSLDRSRPPRVWSPLPNS